MEQQEADNKRKHVEWFNMQVVSVATMIIYTN